MGGGAAPPEGSRRRLAVYPRLRGAPCRRVPQRSGSGRLVAARESGSRRAPGPCPPDGEDGRAAPREGAGRSGPSAARGRRRSHVRAPALPQPGRDVIRRTPAAAPHSRPPRAAASPPRPTCSRLRGCRGRRRPQDDARSPGGRGGGAAPPRPQRLRRGYARGLRTDGGGGAWGGRGGLPAAKCLPGRRLLSHGQSCPQSGLTRVARRARVRSHWAGRGAASAGHDALSRARPCPPLRVRPARVPVPPPSSPAASRPRLARTMIAAAFLVLLRPYSIQCALFLLLLLLGTIATIIFFCCWHRRLQKGRHPMKSVFSGRSRSRGKTHRDGFLRARRSL